MTLSRTLAGVQYFSHMIKYLVLYEGTDQAKGQAGLQI